MGAMAAQEDNKEKRLPKGFFEGQLLMTAEEPSTKKGGSNEDGGG